MGSWPRMIVRCPVCATNYQVDTRALGANGRTVRCAHCSHTWHQAAAPEELVAAEAAPAPILPRELPTPPEPEVSLPPREKVVEETARLPRGDTHIDAEVREPETPRRRRSKSVIGWVVLLLIIAALAGGAVWQRDKVIALWPPALKLYVALGLEPAPTSDGLVIRATPRRDDKDGVPRLVIEGEVINSSSAELAVPQLKVELKDANQRVVQTWTFSASIDRLAAGASVPFTTSVERPNDAATDMRVSFVDEEHP